MDPFAMDLTTLEATSCHVEAGKLEGTHFYHLGDQDSNDNIAEVASIHPQGWEKPRSYLGAGASGPAWGRQHLIWMALTSMDQLAGSAVQVGLAESGSVLLRRSGETLTTSAQLHVLC